MDTTNTTDEDYEQVEEKKLYDRSIIYKVDDTFVKFVCSNDNKYNFLNISCEVDYIDYEKDLTEQEIKILSPVFDMDITIFFNMIEKPPTSVTKKNDNIIIGYTFDILSKKYKINIILSEKITEGKDRNIVIIERRVKALENKLDKLIALFSLKEDLLTKDLKYSYIESSTLENKNIGRCTYTEFLVFLYEHIGDNLKDENIGLNIKYGKCTEKGFHKSKNLKFSFQRKDAKGMLKEIISISKKYNVKISLLIRLHNGEIHYV